MKPVQNLQEILSSKQAFLIIDPTNVRYFSNFTGTNGQLFITKKYAYLLTDFRYLRVAKKVLPPMIKLVSMEQSLTHELQKLIKKHTIQELYFEEKKLEFFWYQKFKKELSVKLNITKSRIENLRMIKTEEEVKLLIKAQQIAEKVFLELRRNLKAGKTEQNLAWEIEKLGHEFGADTVSFTPIIGFQKNSGSPHHQNTTKKLKKGDLILIDMGMKYHGYCSDMTRMIFTKSPTSLEKKIYKTVLEAQEIGIKKLQAGVHGNEIDHVARSHIDQAGYGKNFGHSLGHGIGLEVHESPTLSHNYNKIIPENTIVTVEPGIYLENSFGIRIEDMLLVKNGKAINLTKISKKIEDSIFRIS